MPFASERLGVPQFRSMGCGRQVVRANHRAPSRVMFDTLHSLEKNSDTTLRLFKRCYGS